jgi:2,3-bisphosphoglycerate-dependent phosphoglycerate mutase
VTDQPGLILLRHGRSAWNARGLFTGWADVDLTEEGRAEAADCANLLASSGIIPAVSHSSELRRAVQTAEIVLDRLGLVGVPTHRSWRLNERNYGAWQGRSKRQVLEEVGAEQYTRWRRSYDTAPPRAESLADVLARLLPYWTEQIAPDLERGRTVLITAHSNSLRALIKHLDGLDEAEVLELNVPTGIPLIYDLGHDLRPLTRGGSYLGASAASAIRAVADEGLARPDQDGAGHQP